jgi:hypothetical protein
MHHALRWHFHYSHPLCFLCLFPSPPKFLPLHEEGIRIQVEKVTSPSKDLLDGMTALLFVSRLRLFHFFFLVPQTLFVYFLHTYQNSLTRSLKLAFSDESFPLSSLDLPPCLSSCAFESRRSQSRHSVVYE